MKNPYEDPRWHAAFRPGGAALTQRLLSRACLPPGSAVLDVGCGEGDSCAYLAGAGYAAAGLDSSPVLIRRGKARFPRCTLEAGDAAAPPFAPASRDALLMECVLSAADGPRVLAGCVPLLRPGGVVLLSDLYARAAPDLADRPALYSRGQLEALLESAGLRPLHFEDVSRTLVDYIAQKLMDGADLGLLLGTSTGRFRQARAGYCLMWAALAWDTG